MTTRTVIAPDGTRTVVRLTAEDLRRESEGRITQAKARKEAEAKRIQSAAKWREENPASGDWLSGFVPTKTAFGDREM